MKAVAELRQIESNQSDSLTFDQELKASIESGFKVRICMTAITIATFSFLGYAWPQMVPTHSSAALLGMLAYSCTPGALLVTYRNSLPKSTEKLLKVCTLHGAVFAGFALYITR